MSTDTQLFQPGAVVATRHVAHWMAEDEGGRITRTAFVANCLHRHLTGDWGSLDDEDKATNDRAVRHGERILSAYPFPDHITPPDPQLNATKIWIITEADRSSTTILFPSEY